jgi:sortase A
MRAAKTGVARPMAKRAAAASAPRRRPTLARRVTRASILVLAFSALGFVGWVGLFSALHYDKAQLSAYETLRVELAAGDAPNGPAVPGDPRRLLPAGSPVAVLSIPAIGLRTVIVQGTTSSVLENGPGHLRDTPMPGQAGISVVLGREIAYGAPFGKLASLTPGDSVTVVTGQAVARYKVIDLRRAGDPLPPPPATGQGRMILVTADSVPPTASGILYVDAALTSASQPAPAMVLSPASLSPSENAMGTEPRAWLPVALLVLLLLVTVVLSWLWTAWGSWQTWLIAVPIVGYIGLSSADEVTRLLPNLM